MFIYKYIIIYKLINTKYIHICSYILLSFVKLLFDIKKNNKKKKT